MTNTFEFGCECEANEKQELRKKIEQLEKDLHELGAQLSETQGRLCALELIVHKTLL